MTITFEASEFKKEFKKEINKRKELTINVIKERITLTLKNQIKTINDLMNQTDNTTSNKSKFE